MFTKHVTEKLSAYYNGELSPAEARAVGEHLLACPSCRQIYADIELGAQLAEQLPEVAAPVSLWSDIEALLDAPPSAAKQASQPSRFTFRWQRLAVAATLLLVALGVAAVWYNASLNQQLAEASRVTQSAPHLATPELPSDATVSTASPPAATDENRVGERNEASQKTATPRPPQRREPPTINLPPPAGDAVWEVARLAGKPKVAAVELENLGKIAVGEWLETDEASRARITVGSIGHVEVAPNSRIRLLAAKETEHRLALAVGTMHARIDAPPRLFFVNTPSAQAIDLGCEYTLEVDESGASVLRVQSGWVAFVSNGRESLVPENAVAITRKGFAPGTPYFDDASNRFKEALMKFDFAGGDSAWLDVLIREARPRDTLTLWHLLARVGYADRLRLYEKMVRDVPLPEDVTRRGVLRLDKEMLRLWRLDLEVEWYRSR